MSQDQHQQQTTSSDKTSNAEYVSQTQTADEHIETLDEEALEAIVNETVEIAANNIVKNHIIASITMGLVPIPLFDLAALTTAQMNMLRSLSELYGVPFEDSNSKSLITSLVGGSLPVVGVVGLSSFAKLIPGVGSLLGSASLSVTAGAVTYAVGQVFIMHFSEGGTLDDFNPKQAQVFFKREFDAGKAFVGDIREELKAMKEAKNTENSAENNVEKNETATEQTTEKR